MSNYSILRAPYRVSSVALLGALCCGASALTATGQATSIGLVVRTVAEVKMKSADGHGPPRLAPADRVVSGDQVFYTLEIRNASAVSLRSPVVIQAVPAHMSYVAGSATGPRAEITYSTDGGHVFRRPENMPVDGTDGSNHAGRTDEYTHIRWQLRNALKPNSVAFARFCAVVK